ncbi:MAG TPA: class I SAM-dependent methyltransferase [Herpetosiphonaceae bacterium]
MKKLDFRQSYRDLVQSVKQKYAPDEAMHQAIGAEFEAFGIIERELLIQYGLQPNQYVIDVGCGSGRLAKPLSAYLKGPYLGTDVVPDLVDYARALVGRADWRFEVTEGLSIPEHDEQANMVCFFSVFTHLLHEQSYIYLREARRVLKPGGKIIFSFLDFAIPCHWDIFDGNIADIGGDHPLNMFISRDAIAAWSSHLDLEIEAMHDGDKPHIPLSQPVTLDDGRVMEGLGNLGQSVCVLVKR